MDWRLILIQALARLIETHGPEIIDAIGDFLIELIKSLSPDDREKAVAMLIPSIPTASG